MGFLRLQNLECIALFYVLGKLYRNGVTETTFRRVPGFKLKYSRIALVVRLFFKTYIVQGDTIKPSLSCLLKRRMCLFFFVHYSLYLEGGNGISFSYDLTLVIKKLNIYSVKYKYVWFFNIVLLQ